MTKYLDTELLTELWNFADPAASEQRFRKEILARSADAPATLELRTQLARALGLQGRFEEGMSELDAIRSEDDRVLARVNLEQGRLRHSAGDPAAAGPSFQLAREYAAAAGDAWLEVDALHMLAIADEAHGTDWSNQALAIADVSDDPRVRGWRGALHNNLGWTLHDAGDHPGALEHFRAALAAYKERGTPDQVHIAWWSLARCYRSLGLNAEALAIQRRLVAEDPPDEYVAEELAILEAMA